MPSRTKYGIGVGLAGFGDALGDYASQRQRQLAQQEGAAAGQQQDILKALAEQVAQGKMQPDQAQAAAAAQGLRLPPGHFAMTEPPVSQRIVDLIAGIDSADSFQKVPGETSLRAQVKAKRLPVQFGPMAQATPTSTAASGNLPSTQFGPVSPGEREVFRAREEKIASFPPVKQSVTMPDGSTRDRFVAADPRTLTGQEFSTGLSAEQQGRNARTTWLQNEGSPERTARTIANANATEAGTRGEKVKTAGGTAYASRNAALQAEVDRMGLTDSQKSSVLQLADDFSKQSREFYVQEDSMRKITALAKSPDSAAASLGIVFAYMKILDAGSTVREGEQATARNATGVPDWVRNLYNRTLTGASLSRAQIADFTQQAAAQYVAARQGHQERVGEYTQRAQGLGVDPSLVVRPPSPSADRAAAPTSSRTTTAAPTAAPRPGRTGAPTAPLDDATALLQSLRSRGGSARAER